MGCSTSSKKAVDVVADSGLVPDVKRVIDIPDSGLIDVPDGAGREAKPDPDIPAIDDVLPYDDVQNKGECCDTDDDCTSALVCIGSTGEGMLGTCQHKPNKTRCYSDETCPEFYFCDGGQICTCDMDCATEEGKCETTGLNCCVDDAECPEGTRCVGTGTEAAATCFVLPAKDYKCWDDVDCNPGEVCVNSKWCGCPYFFCDSYLGNCKEEGLAQCIAKHSGCGCEEGCADGFTTYVYYPDSAGEFAEDISPPPELLEVALARYDCGICSCTESWQAPMDGEWVDFEGGPEEVCLYLQELDDECGGCLVEWFGGCC